MTTPTPDPTALPRLVEAADVARRMGETFDAGDTARVESYIESVTAVVLDEGLPEWADVTTCPARVRVLVIDAVERRVNNPELLTQRQLAGDLEMMAADPGWLTEAELRTVRRLAGKSVTANEGATVGTARTSLPDERTQMFGHPWPEDYFGRSYGGYGDAYGYGVDYYDDGYPV